MTKIGKKEILPKVYRFLKKWSMLNINRFILVNWLEKEHYKKWSTNKIQ